MEVLAGKVLHFYSRLSVASVEVTDLLNAGDFIHIRGQTTDFNQKIESLQVLHKQVSTASRGMIVGIKVTDYVRKNDSVYRIVDEAVAGVASGNG